MEEHSRDVKMKMKMKMKMKGLVCLFLLLEMCCYYSDASRTISVETQKFDVDKYLKRLNKTPVKSIKSPDGDIIDCVDIYKQPAFDHPLLRNHSIQMRPNNSLEGLFTDKTLSKNTEFENRGSNGNHNSETIIPQMWHKNGRCPEGTIPIRRSTKEDLLRAESIERFGMKSPGSIDQHEHAIVVFDGNYYGAKAAINTWQPHVQQSDEFSLSHMFIMAGPLDSDFNSIEVGWQVFPNVYGDFKSRLYIYWTSDGQRSTGCYDLRCPGFIQTNKDIVLGSVFDPVSSYDGDQRYMEFTIFKAPADGNWWLAYGRAEIIGYWPASLFTHLNKGVTEIQVGGEVMNMKKDGMHTTTEMGSGHFSGEGYSRASFIDDIMVVNSSIRSQYPEPGSFYTSTSNNKCYDLNIKQYSNGEIEFYHGGPGRNANCP